MTAPLLSSRNDMVQDAILNILIERRLTKGDPLPTEPELQRLIGTSRSSVREAIKVLQAVGILEVRHGNGTFVSERPLVALEKSLRFRTRIALATQRTQAEELIELRELLECGLISNVAQSVPEETIDELQRIADEMEEAAANRESLRELDEAFHKALYTTLENTLLLDLTSLLWEIYHSILEETYRQDPLSQQDARIVAEAHRKVVDALRARDVILSIEAMKLHFQGIRNTISEYLTS